MARIKRGLKSFQRKRARNFTHEQAQKRLDETVKPFNNQVDNSLRVNAVEIDYYNIVTAGSPCSCERTKVVPEFGNMDIDTRAPQIHTDDGTNQGYSMDFQDSLFGDEGEQGADSVIDMIEGLESKPHEPEYEEALTAGGNVNCGICYRTGFEPGYVAYNKQRHVMLVSNVVNMEGFYINTANKPHTFEKQTDDGFVEFLIPVPKYWANATFSVRDNTDYLVGAKLYDQNGRPIGSNNLVENAGKEMLVRVYERQFTHAVLEFEMNGTEKLFGNIGVESETLDYTRLSTMGSIPLVLPPKVTTVEPGDIVVIKKRKLVLKITDRERKITSDSQRLEWVCTTRVLQPSEVLKMLHQGTRIRRV